MTLLMVQNNVIHLVDFPFKDLEVEVFYKTLCSLENLDFILACLITRPFFEYSIPNSFSIFVKY